MSRIRVSTYIIELSQSITRRSNSEGTVGTGEPNVKFLSCYFFFVQKYIFLLEIEERKDCTLQNLIPIVLCLKVQFAEYWNKIYFILTLILMLQVNVCSIFCTVFVFLSGIVGIFKYLLHRAWKLILRTDKQLYNNNSENVYSCRKRIKRKLKIYRLYGYSTSKIISQGLVPQKIKPNFKHGFLVWEHVTPAYKILLSLYSERQYDNTNCYPKQCIGR